MTTNSDDLALETLLAIRAEIAPEIDEQIIRSCYTIQKKHQFDRDRAVAAQAMENLVEQYLDKITALNTRGDSAS